MTEGRLGSECGPLLLPLSHTSPSSPVIRLGNPRLSAVSMRHIRCAILTYTRPPAYSPASISTPAPFYNTSLEQLKKLPCFSTCVDKRERREGKPNSETTQCDAGDGGDGLAVGWVKWQCGWG